MSTLTLASPTSPSAALTLGARSSSAPLTLGTRSTTAVLQTAFAVAPTGRIYNSRYSDRYKKS